MFSKLWSAVTTFVKHEPAVLLSVAGAGIGLGATFGFHLSPAESKEVYAGITTAAGLVIRQFVSPTAKVPTAAQTEAVAGTIEKDGEKAVAVVEEVEKLSTKDRLDRLEAAVSALSTPPDPQQ